MKKIFMIAMAMAFAVSLAVAKDCPGMKDKDGKDAKKCCLIDKAKSAKVAGEVVKVEKDTKSNPACQMDVVTLKTDKGEKKVLLCRMKSDKSDVKVGDKLDLKGCEGPCKMGGKETKMFCAMEGTCNGNSMKMDMKNCPLMKDKDGKKEKMGKCPYMAGEKKDKKEKEVKKEEAAKTPVAK